MTCRNLNLLLLAALFPATMCGEVVISEILSHTDPPLEDAIELQNLGSTDVDISYWWLSDERSEPQKFLIPPGTTIRAGGFIVFYQAQFENGTNGFSLNAANGDQVYLSAGDSQGNLTGQQTSAKFGALANGISVGQVPISTGFDFAPLAYRTFGVDAPASLPQFRQGQGLSNAPPRVGPVVISEIMFRPDAPKDSEANLYEYLELHNPTFQTVPLHDPIYLTNVWRMEGGIYFDFPLLFSLPPGGFVLLVSFNPAVETNLLALFKAKFAVPGDVPILGPYEGRLNDQGETLELLTPDEPQGLDQPDAGFVPYLLLERISYGLGNGWPANTSGTGLSLQRRSMLAYGNDPANWLAALPSAGQQPRSDSDGDRLPDEWEIAHGLDPHSAADAGIDPDGDHFINFEEYIAGTDPRNPDSLLQINNITRTGEGFLITFLAQADRNYSIQQQLLGTWQMVGRITNNAIAGPTQLLIPETDASLGLFRLTVNLPP